MSATARWIATTIKRLLSDDGALYVGEEGAEERVTARDIYVLTRTHSDEIKLEKHFRELEIPYAFYKQGGLFQTAEAQEIYEVLRAIERPHDRGRRLRAWATPFFAIELEDLVQCRDVPETHPCLRPCWSGTIWRVSSALRSCSTTCSRARASSAARSFLARMSAP